MYEVKFDLERDEFLLSTAMISSIWEEKKNDSIDLLVDFIKYTIHKITKVNDVIDLKELHAKTKIDFYFKSIPEQIIEEILRRLKEKTYGQIVSFDKKSSCYYLDKDLSGFAEEFDKRIKFQKESLGKVFDDLSNYYKTNFEKNYSQKEVKAKFIRFIAKEGFDFLQCPEIPNSIRKITSNRGQDEYIIAQYILSVREDIDKKDIYDSVLRMTAGYFISKSIYIDSSKDYFKKNPPLKDLNVYIDTTLLLYILDCKTEYQHQSAMSMVNILKSNGANLYYYQHNLDEVVDIITKYKNNRNEINPYRTLERFDKDKFSDMQIVIFLETIEERLKEKSIYLKATHAYKEYSSVIDESGLSKYLSKYISGYKEKTQLLDNDVKSISSVCMERNSVRTKMYENTTSICVTSNSKLVKYANVFLEFNNDSSISPIITDRKLTTDLWIRYGNNKSDLFETYLLENALVAIEPTPELLSRFFENVEKFVEMGNISPETAAIVRAKCITDKNLMIATSGDPNNLNESTTNEYIEKCKEEIIGETVEEKDKKIEELEKQLSAVEINNDKAISKKDEQINELVNKEKKREETALHQVETDTDKITRIFMIIIKIAYFLLLVIIALVMGCFCVIDFISLAESDINIVLLIVKTTITILEIIYTILEWRGKFGIATKYKGKVYNKVRSILYGLNMKIYNRYNK